LNFVRLEGERNYSYIHLTNHKKKLVTKTLAELEEMLDGKGFFRCHKSFLINAYHIKINANNTILTLADDAEIPIARRKKEGFKVWYAAYLEK
jgi:two-component system LytT family response regulator